jgi:hypothetical protein
MTSIREVRFIKQTILMSSETDLSRNQAIQNQRNSFSRGFPLPFNVETLQAFGADQNNTVKSLSSGNNRKNILKNPSSLDFKIRTFLIDQSRVGIKLP